MISDREVSSLDEEARKRQRSEDEMRALYGEYIEQGVVFLLKPECFPRKIIGKILQRLEDKGMRIVKARTVHFDRQMVESFYPHIVEKPFFERVVANMVKGPVLAFVIKGHLALQVLRLMLGPTNPLEAECGTIRGDFGGSLESEGNIAHCSDSSSSYERELELIFKDDL